MIAHHLPLDMLVDYAAGSLAEGPALMVASHVALCAQCRAQVARFEDVGGALLEEIAPTPLSDGAFERVLRRIDSEPKPEAPPKAEGLAAMLPLPLRRYVGNAPRWRPVGINLEEVALPLSEGPHQASLLRVKNGRPMARHRHSGVEFTLVLEGAFTDRGVRYAPGDVCLAAEPEHQPLADAGVDCICLAVIDGPLVLTGPLGCFLNPLMRRRAKLAAAVGRA